MMLGAINPINLDAMKARITAVQSSPQALQTFATATGQSYNPNIRAAATASNVQPSGDDMMTMIKKYAPYLIGAAIIYYLILQNKK